MYRFATGALDIEDLRERLRKMSDAELRRFGEAARYMCSPKANMGHPPRQNFMTQLEEAKAEWKRRHKPADPDCVMRVEGSGGR